MSENQTRSTWNETRALMSRFTSGTEDYRPDSIIEALRDDVLASDWQRIPGFDDADDESIAKFVLSRFPPNLTGALTIVADTILFAGTAPFRVRVDALVGFASSFVDAHADELFGGDCLLVHTEVLVVVHHEGLMSVIAPAPPPPSSRLQK